MGNLAVLSGSGLVKPPKPPKEYSTEFENPVTGEIETFKSQTPITAQMMTTLLTSIKSQGNVIQTEDFVNQLKGKPVVKDSLTTQKKPVETVQEMYQAGTTAPPTRKPLPPAQHDAEDTRLETLARNVKLFDEVTKDFDSWDRNRQNEFLKSNLYYRITEADPGELEAARRSNSASGFGEVNWLGKTARGQNLNKLKAENAGMTYDTASGKYRADANKLHENASNALSSMGVPEWASGLISAFMPNVIAKGAGAEAATLSDPDESSANKWGAASNLAALVVTSSLPGILKGGLGKNLSAGMSEVLTHLAKGNLDDAIIAARHYGVEQDLENWTRNISNEQKAAAHNAGVYRERREAPLRDKPLDKTFGGTFRPVSATTKAKNLADALAEAKSTQKPAKQPKQPKVAKPEVEPTSQTIPQHQWTDPPQPKKPLWDMADDELDAYREEMRKWEKEGSGNPKKILSPERYQKWKEAFEGTGLDEGLTEAEERQIYGIGGNETDLWSVQDVDDAIRSLDKSNIAESAKDLGYFMRHYLHSPDRYPLEIASVDRMIKERGWNPNEVIDAAQAQYAKDVGKAEAASMFADVRKRLTNPNPVATETPKPLQPTKPVESAPKVTPEQATLIDLRTTDKDIANAILTSSSNDKIVEGAVSVKHLDGSDTGWYRLQHSPNSQTVYYNKARGEVFITKHSGYNPRETAKAESWILDNASSPRRPDVEVPYVEQKPKPSIPPTKLQAAKVQSKIELDAAIAAHKSAPKKIPNKKSGGINAATEVRVAKAWAKHTAVSGAVEVEKFVKFVADELNWTRTKALSVWDEAHPEGHEYARTAKPPKTPAKPPVESPQTKGTVEGGEVPVGVSHEALDLQREHLGFAPRTGSVKGDTELLSQAGKLKGKGVGIAQDLLNPKTARKTLTDVETVALGQDLLDAKNAMQAARKAGDDVAYDYARAEANTIADALDKSGSEQGRAFRARRFIENEYGEFEFGRDVENATEGMDGVLTQKRIDQRDKIAAELQTTVESQAKELQAARDEIQKMMDSGGGSTPKAKGTPQQKRSTYLKNLQNLGFQVQEGGASTAKGGGFGTKKAGAVRMPDWTADGDKITAAMRGLVRSYADEGLKSWADVVKRIQQDLPGMDENHIAAILNNNYRKVVTEAQVARLNANKFLADVTANAKWKQKSIPAKAGSVALQILNTIPRAAQTTLDDSLALIQGKNVLTWRPDIWAKSVGKSIIPFTKRGLDPIKHADESIAAIKGHEAYAEAVQSGLKLSETHGSVGRQEEFFAGFLENKIPGIAHSKSAGTVLGNEMRWQLYLSLRKQAPVDAVQRAAYLKDIAGQINIATGKGHGKIAEALRHHGGVAGYAPGFTWSKWQHSAGVSLFGAKTAKGREMAFKMYASQAVAMVGLVKASELFGGKVDLDPRSNGFGRVTFGDQTYDLFRTQGEAVRIVAQLFYGSISNKGNYAAPDKYGAKTLFDYAESKSSVLYRFIKMASTGQTYDDTTGEYRDVEPMDYPKMYVPISIKEGKGTARETWAISFIGGNVQKAKEQKPKTPAPPFKMWPLPAYDKKN